MSESRARGTPRGLACGRLCVLRQWFNRLVCSCSIIKNMLVKVETFIADVMFSKVSEYEDHV